MWILLPPGASFLICSAGVSSSKSSAKGSGRIDGRETGRGQDWSFCEGRDGDDGCWEDGALDERLEAWLLD